MRRLALVAVILLLTPLASAVPEATVELKIERKLANFDLGINGGESVSYTHLTLPTKRIV